jgi:Ca2+-binding EF-hand superfamily protein
VKLWFDDYCKNPNSPIQVDNVTTPQFRNGLARLGLQVTAAETELLVRRFAGKAQGFVDYVAFACAVDEGEKIFSKREPQSVFVNTLHSGFRQTRVSEASLVGKGDQPGRAPTVASQPRLPMDKTPASADVWAVIRKLQDKAKQYQLRLQYYFKDFDKHNDGSVTQPQLIKILSVAYDKVLSLTENDIMLLVSRYGRVMPHGATHVLWRDLVRDIEEAFTTAGMEKDPDLQVKRQVFGEQRPIELPAPREERVQAILAALRRRVEVRRVLVKPLFSDYEQQVNSAKVVDHITRSQMVQALSRLHVELTAEDAALLFERYDTLNDGTVNYIALVRDIDPYEAFSSRNVTQHTFPHDPDYGKVSYGKNTQGWTKAHVNDGLPYQPGRPAFSNDCPRVIPAPPSATLEQLLNRLRADAARGRIRVEDMFRDFDRHRDGTITVGQFQMALNMTFGKLDPLSGADVALLVDHYQVAKPGALHVKWKAFVDDVNTIFTASGLERNPEQEVPAPVAPAPPKVSTTRLSAEEDAELQALLNRFRFHVRTRRLLVKPFFLDLECSRRSMRVVDHVTSQQFMSCLGRLGLEATADEVALLRKKYDDRGDGTINYIDFTTAIDADLSASARDAAAPAAVARTAQSARIARNGGFNARKTMEHMPGRSKQSATVPTLVSNKPPGTLEELMWRLQNKCIQFTIPVRDAFVDYDTNRKGAITVPQFRAALNRAFGGAYVRADVHEDELLTLERAYAAVMADGATFFRWRDFCKDLERAAVQPHLEANPDAPILTRRIERKAVALSDEEERRVAEILGAMRRRCSIRSIYPKQFLADFARSRVGYPMVIDHVTKSQFVKALSRLGVEPSAEQISLLAKKFDDDGEGMINYVAFCCAVDDQESSSLRSADAAKGNTLHGGFRDSRVPVDMLKRLV